MNCKRFQSNLDEYLQRTLPSKDLEAMQQHADTCDDCRGWVVQFEQISKTVRILPRVAAPSDFEEILLRRIRAGREKKAGLPWISLRRPGLQVWVYATLLLAVGVSIILLPLNVSPDKPDIVRLEARGNPSDEQPAKSIPEVAGFTGFRLTAPDREFNLFDRELMPVRASWGDSSRPPEPEYVDYLLKGTGQNEVFVRIPRTLLYRAPANGDRYYIRNISH